MHVPRQFYIMWKSQLKIASVIFIYETGYVLSLKIIQ